MYSYNLSVKFFTHVCTEGVVEKPPVDEKAHFLKPFRCIGSSCKGCSCIGSENVVHTVKP